MRAPTLNVFKKAESSKPAPEHPHHSAKGVQPAVLFKSMPSWWVTLMAYALAAGFCYLTRQFFLWFPPYLREVFKNLRGLPISWADIGLFWGERGLIWIAVAAAIYHNLWQVSTRYQLTSHDIQIETWFPFRRVISTPYGSVRRVGYQQSPLGLIFNYGHIEIDTGSPSGLLVLLNCPRPKKFISLLQAKVEPILQPHLAPHRRSTDPQ